MPDIPKIALEFLKHRFLNIHWTKFKILKVSLFVLFFCLYFGSGAGTFYEFFSFVSAHLSLLLIGIISAVFGNAASFDRFGVFLPLAVAQEFLAIGGDVHEYALLSRDKHDNERLAKDLQAVLPTLKVSPWQEIEATFYRTMQSDKQGNYFTMGLIVFIVFIGVLNTVLMSVLERTKEFGVLKSIGCRPSELVKLIFIETVMLATASILVGLVLIVPVIMWFTEVGLKLDLAVDMGGVVFDTMKGDFSAYVILMPMGFMLATAAVISLPPGLRAARILPREAMGSH